MVQLAHIYILSVVVGHVEGRFPTVLQAIVLSDTQISGDSGIKTWNLERDTHVTRTGATVTFHYLSSLHSFEYISKSLI